MPEGTLDKYDFFAVSQYCNALVSDAGGQEPRFSCNMLINSRDEVYNVIQQMTAIFADLVLQRWISHVCKTGQLILNTRLVKATLLRAFFSIQASQKARHTVAVVAWQSTHPGIKSMNTLRIMLL